MGGAEVLKSLRDKWAGKGLTTGQLVTKLVMSKGHWMPVLINPTTRVKETRRKDCVGLRAAGELCALPAPFAFPPAP